MSHETLSLRVAGVAPLLMRNGRLADPLDPQSAALDRITRQRLKTNADYTEIARLEWFASLWLVDGRPCVIAEAIEAAILAAARKRRLGPAVRAGVMVEKHAVLEHDGPQDLDKLFADQRFSLRVPVQVNGRRTMRTRPRFCHGRSRPIAFLPQLVSARDLQDFVTVAGDQIGLGDWRPRFGRWVSTRL